MLTEGARITGVQPVEVKVPEDITQDGNLWEEYKVDLIGVTDMGKWREFRKKWFSWLNDDSIALDMTPDKIHSLVTELRMRYHNRLVSPRAAPRWVADLMYPRVFVVCLCVRRASAKNPRDLPKFNDVFFSVASLGYFKVDDDGRLFLDEKMLELDPGEQLAGPDDGMDDYMRHLFRAISDEDLAAATTGPNPLQIVDGLLEQHHNRERIYTY